MKKILIVLEMIVLLAAACVPSAAQTTLLPATYMPDVSVIVAETFAAMTAQAALTQPAAEDTATSTPTLTPTITVTPTPVPGSISGTLSYPSEFIPPLRIVAFSLDGFNYRYVDTMQDQSNYQIAGLAPGLYHVVAYVMDGSYAGGYTAMVSCGLSAGCNDHSLIDVVVESGKDTPNIAPGDWYAPPDFFPPMP